MASWIPSNKTTETCKYPECFTATTRTCNKGKNQKVDSIFQRKRCRRQQIKIYSLIILNTITYTPIEKKIKLICNLSSANSVRQVSKKETRNLEKVKKINIKISETFGIKQKKIKNKVNQQLKLRFSSIEWKIWPLLWRNYAKNLQNYDWKWQYSKKHCS